MKVSAQVGRSLPSGSEVGQTQLRSGSRGVVALVVVALVLLAAFVLILPYVPGVIRSGISQLTSSLPSGIGGNTTTTTAQSFNLYDPLIAGGLANISYPSDFNTLAGYALNDINHDRTYWSQSNITNPAYSTLPNVTLSNSSVAQQHADSMLKYGYFSHVDTQGFKPYMRYSLLGGKGAVEENVAYVYNCDGYDAITNQCINPRFTTTSSVESVISGLEYQMMYNDSGCCSNGHRSNILTSLHNRVSIGIAYNGTTVYFVEDFENYYINLRFSVSNTYAVSMTGTPLKSTITSNAIYVAYDPTPSAQTPFALNSGPREYNPGTIIGGVLPTCKFLNPCGRFEQGITVYADTWKFSSTTVDIAFSLQDFINQYHGGAYTVYLITGSDTSSAITSISVFVA
jgi:hypothetical protein